MLCQTQKNRASKNFHLWTILTASENSSNHDFVYCKLPSFGRIKAKKKAETAKISAFLAYFSNLVDLCIVLRITRP